ncbi:MAG: four helix bundle protein [Phycisphaerae bacterium]
MAGVTRVEDLEVYRRRCQLHLDVCRLSQSWPRDERFELTSQVRRSSNSAPANLAEKHSDRHMRNRIEGVNRARGEALETIHHLYVARLKGYVSEEEYEAIRQRYHDCVRMLNGLERAFERHLPTADRRWGDRAGAPPHLETRRAVHRGCRVDTDSPVPEN